MLGSMGMGRLGFGRFGRLGGALNAYLAYLLADDFDNSKYWQTDDNTGASGTTETDVSQLAGYTFTAAGSCYELNSDGTIAGPFGPDVPAITDEGFKARQSLTNLLLRSQEFDDPAWAKTLCTVTANAATAPDGTTTMDRLVISASGGSGISQAIVVAASTTRTASIFVPKTLTFGHVYLDISDNVANRGFRTIDLATGTQGTLQNLAGSGISITAYRVDAGDYWRVVFVWVTTTNTSPTLFFGPCDAADSRSVSAGNQDAWQFQDILGNLPDGGPIIVTTAAAATRGEALLTHNIFADGSALQDEDMLIWAKGTPDEIVSTALHYILDLHIDANNRIGLYLDTSGVATGVVVNGGATAYSQSAAGAIAAGTEAVLLLRRSGGNWRFAKYVGGALTWGTEAAGAFPATMTKTAPGGYHGGSNNFRGTVDSAFIKPGTFSTDQAVIDAITGAP